VTFTLPEAASPRWAGLPHPDQAAPIAIVTYLGAYGPASLDAFGTWLAGGWFGKRRLRAFFDALGERLSAVDVDGERAFVLAEHLDDLASARPTKTIRLLGAFDQYVLGPGTGDAHVVPATRRALVSRQAGWISPVVVAGGVVSGTWVLDGGKVRIAWFGEAGAPPRRALATEVARLASVLERELSTAVAVV
jgi:hypothetical protein